MKKVIATVLIIALIASFCVLITGCAEKPVEIKNVIVFIGDGMGFNHIYNAQTYFENAEVFDFDDNCAGSVTTRSLNNEVTDSAAAATALATGNKVNNGNVSRLDGIDLESITEIAQNNGKKTGIITSDDLFGATPACYSAHADSRGDTDKIVLQQAQSGIDLLVGRTDDDGLYALRNEEFVKNGYVTVNDINSLLAAPKNQKILANLNGLRSNYVDGIEDNGIDFANLLKFAFDYLDNENGFFLMVENAYIDKRSHTNNINEALCEVRSFSDAVNAALNYFANRKDTVIIVTADHETGGLTLANGKDEIANDLYTKTSHSAANVPLYVFGYDTGEPREYDNTEIFDLCKSLIDKNSGKED